MNPQNDRTNIAPTLSLTDSKANRNHVPIAYPEGSPGEEFVDEVRQIIASGRLTNGSRVRKFEQAAAEYLGVAHCVAVSSCTAGLLLTLRALGLRGEVILPSFTFHATAHSVLWNGLKPVFADCDEGTFCIDPSAVEAKLSPATAAILAVHLFGCPASVDELQQISVKAGIPLIYDAAHAFGSESKARHIGTFGIAEVFSFSPTKLIVAGEGGLIATSNGDLAERLRAARNYGDTGDSDPHLLGLNARMSELHAALALSGLAHVEERIQRRNEIRAHYISRLTDVPGLSFQTIPESSRSACKDMPVLVEERAFGTSRDSVISFLGELGIEARRYFSPPVHRQKLYSSIWDREPLRVTECVANRVLSLPIYSLLTSENVDRICDAVIRAFEIAQQRNRKPGSRVEGASVPPRLLDRPSAARGTI